MSFLFEISVTHGCFYQPREQIEVEVRKCRATYSIRVREIRLRTILEINDDIVGLCVFPSALYVYQLN